MVLKERKVRLLDHKGLDYGCGQFRSVCISLAQSAWDIPYLDRKIFLFHYFVIRFLLNNSIVKSDSEIGKVNDKKDLI